MQLGVRDVRIVVGHHGEVIKRHFEDGSHFGVAITYVDNPRVDLELPFSVYQAGRAIDQPCVMLLADECYVGSNHAQLLSAADPTAEVVLGQIAAEYAKQIRKNYVLSLRDGLIVDLIEKPSYPTGRMMGVGTYLLQPAIFRRLEAAYAGGDEAGPRDWTSWLASLSRAGVRMTPFTIGGRYVNINSRDDLNGELPCGRTASSRSARASCTWSTARTRAPRASSRATRKRPASTRWWRWRGS